MNYNFIKLANLFDSKDEVIHRNSISIKKQLQKLEDDFYQSRKDDQNSTENDFNAWLINRQIIINTKYDKN